MDCQIDTAKESSATIQYGSHSSNTNASGSRTSSEIQTEERRCAHSTFVAKSKSDRNPPLRTGRWTPNEKILFLYGLRMFGKGRWKKMSVYLPQRSLVQIKSHAQKVLKRQQAGENIFRRLEENYSEIDNLVVQAARQRDALRMARKSANPSVSTPRKNFVTNSTKENDFDARIPASQTISATVTGNFFHKSINNTAIPVNNGSDGSVLAAAALCQLSSIGGSWDRRKSSTMTSGKG
mmetsp:Transcript_22366/g.53218  ORF Transcript_22366/g.53218 Transcript_22366/m.53218 type:complete len:237 (+) Transcript_22366:171-881(+)